jgi:hypothetical protein
LSFGKEWEIGIDQCSGKRKDEERHHYKLLPSDNLAMIDSQSSTMSKIFDNDICKGPSGYVTMTR